ncbi:hypothetical protein GF324_03525 [bacterium]|nr:hypothetical protein [bacterium]
MSTDEKKQQLLDDIKAQFGDKILNAGIDYGMPVVVIDPSIHVELPKWLKAHESWTFNHFIDITAVDYLNGEHRYEVVVHLRSHANNLKMRMKTPIGVGKDVIAKAKADHADAVAKAKEEAEKEEKEPEEIPAPEFSEPSIPSLTEVFLGANWSEREVWDFYGITFEGHPRLTRVLNPDDFVGYPLRKDFPVKGQHRGSFPRGTVISNKRREPVMAKRTKPEPADHILPRTPWEQEREPVRKKEGDNHA